jgi:electron transport complex protein RnfA
MGVYLALITTNCAVLGTTLNCISKNYNYVQSLVYAAGTACGFLIAMVIMSGVRERMKSSTVPKFLQGKPILFITAGLLSLSFLGFSGLIK